METIKDIIALLCMVVTVACASALMYALSAPN